MKQLTVQLIAPEVPGLPALGWLKEINSLQEIEGVTLKVLGGPDVDVADVAKALRARNDVVIWSGHGVCNGLMLPPPSRTPIPRYVRSQWLATQIKCGAPRLLVLAACGSQLRDEHMQSLADEVARKGINVVGFPVTIEDEAAILYNTELIQALAADADIGTATEVAREAITDQWPASAAGVFLHPGLTNGYGELIRRLEALEAGQARTMERLDQITALLERRNRATRHHSAE